MATPTKAKVRVMVDANILLAGVVWPRWPYEVLRHAVFGDYQLVLSPYVIEEARRHISKTFPDTAKRFEDILKLLNYEAIDDPTPEAIQANLNLSRDIKDVPVALAAINAKVNCLISYDKDLTESDLLKQQVEVLLPPVFLRDYMGWNSDKIEAVRGRNWSDI